jgi:RNA polymerase-binding transcription factor DksA
MSAPERTVVVHEVLSQDADEPSQREDERAIGQALGGIERAELAEIDAALARIDADGYGLCIDCDNPIPYARLKAERAALRGLRSAPRAGAAAPGLKPRVAASRAHRSQPRCACSSALRAASGGTAVRSNARAWARAAGVGPRRPSSSAATHAAAARYSRWAAACP